MQLSLSATLAALEAFDEATNAGCTPEKAMDEAFSASGISDVIERLKAENAAMREALKPFAECAGSDAIRPSTHPIRESNRMESLIWSYYDNREDKTYRITCADMRAARAAIPQDKERA